MQKKYLANKHVDEEWKITHKHDGAVRICPQTKLRILHPLSLHL